MYISISAQKLGKSYAQSSADFVNYLEKENQSLEENQHEHFFNQSSDGIDGDIVVREIDANTAKLKKIEPKFYSITVSPSKYELKRLENSREDLKTYTREIMKDYAACFNREINGKSIQVTDLKYFAKIEHQRTYRGTDKEIKENQPFAQRILQLKSQIRDIQEGRSTGQTNDLYKEITKLEREAPHQQNGKRIVQGMLKEGKQCHIHIIVSRKDASNSISLSPGSQYKASDVEMHGKQVKRGFDRDAFFTKAETTFDRTFAYNRNFVETYHARKTFVKDTNLYFAALLKLPANEKALAFKLMGHSGLPLVPNIPTKQSQLALRTFKRLLRGVEIAIKSSSIGI